jgi:DNA replication protein DnaC
MPQHHKQQHLDHHGESIQTSTSPRLAEESSDEKVSLTPSPTRQTNSVVCPTCKFPLQETAHGWVRDYSEHTDHADHHRKFGYCEVPCPTCTTLSMQRLSARRQAEHVMRLFGSSHLPQYARDWSFETLPTDVDAHAKAAISSFVQLHLRRDPTSKRGLWLAGGPGRCKTGLAISALKEVMHYGESTLFLMTIELINKLRASFGSDADYSEDEVLDAVTSVRWLVLDDLATERPTPYVLEQLYYIIEKRRSQGLYTIFTSNLSTKDVEQYWRPAGVAEGTFHAGVRVIERIREYCEGVAVRGRNQRAKDW